MNSIKQDIRAITTSFAQASPEQIAQIVATIDRMEQRGGADALVAPLRSRLPSLGVQRPISLRRLTFAPLDPLIVRGPEWRRGRPLVPRTALMALFGIIQQHAPAGDQADAMLANAADDESVRRALGSLLWQRGAEALKDAAMPTDWRQTSGLAEADFFAIRGITVCLLSQADRLRALDRRSDDAQIIRQLHEILTVAAQSGVLAWQATLVLLSGERDFAALAGQVAQELATTPELAQGLDPAFACARELLHDKMTVLSTSGALTPLDLADMAEIIVDLEQGAGPRSERKRAAEQLRRDADRICAQSVARILDQDLLPALVRDKSAHTPADHAVAQRRAEIAARAARSFGLIGCGLGTAEKYEAQMRPIIDRLINPANPLDPIDRARLLEILGKSNLALEVMRRCVVGV